MSRFTILLLLVFLLNGTANADPLSSWSLNLSTVGGANSTGISTVTMNGFSELDQVITSNSGLGNPFSFSGSLGWVQYQTNNSLTPNTFVLPSAYSDLFFRFQSLTGTLDTFGNGAFDSGVGGVTLYLDNGGSLVPDANALALATFSVTGNSNAQDIAYYDGGGANPFYTLDFQLVSATPGLFTDDQNNPLLPGAEFTVIVDGLLDPSLINNPGSVANDGDASPSILINAGQLNPINVQASPPPTNSVPIPGTAALVSLGIFLVFAIRRLTVSLPRRLTT